ESGTDGRAIHDLGHDLGHRLLIVAVNISGLLRHWQGRHWQMEADRRSLVRSSVPCRGGPGGDARPLGIVRWLLRELQPPRGLPTACGRRPRGCLLDGRRGLATARSTFTSTKASTARCRWTTSTLSSPPTRRDPWARAIGHWPPTSTNAPAIGRPKLWGPFL